MKAFIALFCLLAVAAAEPGWGRSAWGRGSGWGGRSWGGRSWGGRSWGARGWGGRWKREAEADPQLLLNNGLRTVYSGINTYPTMYTSGLNTYSGLNMYSTGLFNTGLYNTGITHIVKRDADAEPGWGRNSWGWNGNAGRWGGWGRGSWSERNTWGGRRGWSGRSWGRW